MEEQSTPYLNEHLARVILTKTSRRSLLESAFEVLNRSWAVECRLNQQRLREEFLYISEAPGINLISHFSHITHHTSRILDWFIMRHKKDAGSKNRKNPRCRPLPRNDGHGDHEDPSNSSKPTFKAACWDLEHCDPKRCSGKRLLHFGLMRELSVGQKFSGVVIS